MFLKLIFQNPNCAIQFCSNNNMILVCFDLLDAWIEWHASMAINF